MKILMHELEIQLIEKYLNPEHIMLEWGSGGSTLHFPKFVKQYYSIEHNKEWFNRVSPLSEQITNADCFLVEVPWRGMYKVRDDVEKIKQFEPYINFIKTLDKQLDVVLIDGRARKHCAKAVLPYLTDDSIVFIHDFWRRKWYHEVFEWYDEIDSVPDSETNTGIVALKKKRTT